MRITIMAITTVLLGLAACTATSADDRNSQPAPPPGNITLDFGQFVPEARGIVIQFGRQPDGTNRFRLDVPQRNIHLDLHNDGTSPLGGLDLSKLIQGLQPPAAQSAVPDTSLDPSIDLGEPSVELGDPSAELGKPQTEVPGSSGAALSPNSNPAAEGGANLGAPQAEPFDIPNPLAPGRLPTKSEESPAATTPGGYLGVVAEPVSEALAAQLAALLPDDGGLLVTRVMPDSPGAASGLKPYDILTHYNQTAITSLEQLTALARSGKPGDQVQLRAIRGGKQVELEVTLAAAPTAPPTRQVPPLVPE